MINEQTKCIDQVFKIDGGGGGVGKCHAFEKKGSLVK